MPVIVVDIHAAHEGQRVAEVRSRKLHTARGDQAPDHFRAGGLLEYHQVGLAVVDDRRKLLLASDAAHTNVVTEQPQG